MILSKIEGIFANASLGFAGSGTVRARVGMENKKASYEAPTITSLGSVYEVTLGGCQGVGDGMSASAPEVVVSRVRVCV